MKILLQAAIVSCASLSLGSALNAGQCGLEKCWGAVGIGQDGAYGWALGKATERDAFDAAQAKCDNNCNELRTFYDACGAMAKARNGGWGWAWGQSRAEAEASALGYCSEYGRDCEVTVWACSP